MAKNMAKTLQRIAITGAAGQIAYSLLFRIAAGELFGQDQPIALHLLELPEAIKALEGVAMELEDCAFPLLHEIRLGSSAHEVFANINYALLVGAKPRGPGMERKELLTENAKIFVEQGLALNEVANSNVKVLVVGNPCNTNCLIAMRCASRIPKQNFYAMMRLDQNRAVAQLASKAGVKVSQISNLAIWGNHSTTQVPDFTHAKINGQPALDTIKDRTWLEGPFIETVQKRGAAIIAARGKSSAASAASAAIDSLKAIHKPTEAGEWFSLAVSSDGNPYGIAEGLIFSFPCTSHGMGDWEIAKGLDWDPFIRQKIKSSESELLEEREMIKNLLKGK